MSVYQGLQTLEVLEGADHYNQWIAQTILPFFRSPVLEVGSGIGNITQHLMTHKPFTVSEKDDALIAILREKFERNKEVSVVKLDISASAPRNFPCFATVCAVNVLEHVEDDEEALRNMQALLKEEGRLVLLVPAKRFAFTKLDRTLGHFRRYERDELAEKLERTGYIVERLFFFNMVGLLTWVVRDRVERKDVHLTKRHVAMFDWIVPILKRIEKRVRVPVGISLIAVGRKRK